MKHLQIAVKKDPGKYKGVVIIDGDIDDVFEVSPKVEITNIIQAQAIKAGVDDIRLEPHQTLVITLEVMDKKRSGPGTA